MTTDTPKKKTGMLASLLILAITLAAVLIVAKYFEAIPLYPVYGAAALIVAILCPWLRRNLGNIVLPGMAVVFFYLSLPLLGLNVPVPEKVELPSKETVLDALPEVSWQSSEDSAENEEKEESTSDGTDSTTSAEESDKEAPKEAPVVSGTVPTFEATKPPKRLSEALKNDPATLAAIQRGTDFGSWLVYATWADAEFDHAAQEAEWVSVRAVMPASLASEEEADAKREEMLRAGGVSLDSEGYPVGQTEEAKENIQKFYKQFQTFEFGM